MKESYDYNKDFKDEKVEMIRDVHYEPLKEVKEDDSNEKKDSKKESIFTKIANLFKKKKK